MKRKSSLGQLQGELEPDGQEDLREPWGGLLASAGPRDHIVQLYQDQQFLNRAVCRFAASAIANGEGVILVPTAAHWDAFRPRLEAEGVDTKAAQDCGQLTVVDADELLPNFMRDAMPDAPVFLGLARCHRESPRRGPLSEGPLVGRDGEHPLGAGKRRGQHGPGGSV
jgi:hypothetical protein